jgi:hypothetical protein
MAQTKEAVTLAGAAATPWTTTATRSAKSKRSTWTPRPAGHKREGPEAGQAPSHRRPSPSPYGRGLHRGRVTFTAIRGPALIFGEEL